MSEEGSEGRVLTCTASHPVIGQQIQRPAGVRLRRAEVSVWQNSPPTDSRQHLHPAHSPQTRGLLYIAPCLAAIDSEKGGCTCISAEFQSGAGVVWAQVRTLSKPAMFWFSAKNSAGLLNCRTSPLGFALGAPGFAPALAAPDISAAGRARAGASKKLCPSKVCTNYQNEFHQYELFIPLHAGLCSQTSTLCCTSGSGCHFESAPWPTCHSIPEEQPNFLH